MVFAGIYLLPVAVEIVKSEWVNYRQGDFTISKANAVAPTGDTSPLFFIDLGKNKPIKSQKETAFW
jgi:hypothetical protein